MAESSFVYVTYIRTTPDRLWQALLEPEFTRQYWCEITQNCQWNVGATWEMITPDGTVLNSGEVLEIEPPKRLVITWRKEGQPELPEEGHSRMTYLLEPAGSSVKLTVIHEIDRPGSKLIAAVAGGWPLVLASLKSFLETGQPLDEMRSWAAFAERKKN